MAGPFQVDPNSAREISPVSMQGGFQTIVPASSTVRDVANVIGAVVPYIEQTEKQKAQDALQGQLTSVATALKAAKFPNVQTDLFTSEGMVNPANKAAIKELQKLANASLQGKMPMNYVMERMDLVIKEAVAAAPEWKPELEQAARDLLGFTPQHKMMQELFSDQPTQLSAAEKGQRDAEQQAAKLGITVEEWRGMELQRMKGELQKQQFSLLKSRNEYDANAAAQDVQLSSGDLAMEFSANLREQMSRGGVVNPEESKALIMGAYQREKQRLLANMPRGTDVGVVNANLKVLDDQMNSLLSLADNTSALTYITNNNKFIQEIAKNDVYALEHVGPIFAVAGSEGGIALMNAMSRYNDNPAARELFKKSGQGGLWRLADQLASTRKALGRFQDNTPPASDAQRFEDVQTAGALLQQKGLTGAKAVPLLEWVRQSGGDTASVAALKQNKLVSSLSAVKEAHPQLINLYQSELARLQQEYDTLTVQGAVPQGGVVVANGVVQGAPQVSFKDDNGNSSKYNQWVAKANLLTDFASKYQSTGVLPSTVFPGTDALVKEFNERKVQAQNEATKVRKAVRGPDGKLKFEE